MEPALAASEGMDAESDAGIERAKARKAEGALGMDE